MEMTFRETYRSEFRFPDNPNFVQIGGDFADPMSAIRQCYDLKMAMPYIADYRVLNLENQIIFSRGRPAMPDPIRRVRKLLREGSEE